MRSTHACGLLCALFFFPVAHALCQERTPRQSSRLQIIEERNRALTRSTTLGLYGVWSMLQDREGYLWFGTTTGLYRYDGYELKSFRHSPFESGSLSSNRIRGLYEDHDGTLWIGTRAPDQLGTADAEVSLISELRRPCEAGRAPRGPTVDELRVVKAALYVRTINRQDTLLDVQHDLAAGVYFVRMQGPAHAVSVKVILRD